VVKRPWAEIVQANDSAQHRSNRGRDLRLTHVRPTLDAIDLEAADFRSECVAHKPCVTRKLDHGATGGNSFYREIQERNRSRRPPFDEACGTVAKDVRTILFALIKRTST
jgi:hypothetical protein